MIKQVVSTQMHPTEAGNWWSVISMYVALKASDLPFLFTLQ